MEFDNFVLHIFISSFPRSKKKKISFHVRIVKRQPERLVKLQLLSIFVLVSSKHYVREISKQVSNFIYLGSAVIVV